MDGSVVLKTLFAFAGVIGLILLLYQGLRRWQNFGRLPFLPAQPQGSLHLIEHLVLDAHRRMVVVGDQRQEYVLLLGPHNDILLTMRVRGDKGHHD